MRAFVDACFGTFVAIMLALTLYDTVGPGLPSFCNNNQTGLSCLRDWIGAFSGYAAATGAFIAALYALPYLQQQVREANRQADYVIGDTAPEFVVTRNRHASCMHLTARNLNRRHLIIDGYEIVGSPDLTIHGYKESGKMVGFRPDLRIMVNGWTDRSQSPPAKRIEIYVRRGDEVIDGGDLYAAAITLRVSYRMIGQEHQRRMATASSLEVID
ncbi:hypothetical protein [Mesorhizobium sp. CAU 1732]|uniref:hypothetical protein n=1 Tax=Mesorhizobium sp. CAU 1732 TaxID=3140358 RepID=UPI003260B117